MTDKQHRDGLAGPTSDDELIEYVPNRRVIITAGNCARIEQRRLEKETGLEDDGRTPKPDPRGYFP
jgi:hypothetical protein